MYKIGASVEVFCAL